VSVRDYRGWICRRIWSAHIRCYVPDFSNILSKSTIERLADVDEFEVVREVQVSSVVAPDIIFTEVPFPGIFCRLCAPAPLSVFT